MKRLLTWMLKCSADSLRMVCRIMVLLMMLWVVLHACHIVPQTFPQWVHHIFRK